MVSSIKKKLKPTTHSNPSKSSNVSNRTFKYAWIIRLILFIHAVVTLKLPNVYLKALDTLWARLVVAALVVLLLCVDIVSSAMLVAVYVLALVIYRNRLMHTPSNLTTSGATSSLSIQRPHTGGVLPNVPMDMPDDIINNLYPRGDPGRDRGMPGMENMESMPSNQYESQIGTLPVTREQGMFGSNLGFAKVNQGQGDATLNNSVTDLGNHYESQIGTLPVTREQGMFGSNMEYAKVNQGQGDTTLNNIVEGFGDQCGAQVTRSHEAFDNMGSMNSNDNTTNGSNNTSITNDMGYDDGASKTYLEAQRAQDAGFTTADHLRKVQSNTIMQNGATAMDHQVVASQNNMWNSQGAPTMCQAPGTNNQLCYSGLNMNSLNLAENVGM